MSTACGASLGVRVAVCHCNQRLVSIEFGATAGSPFSGPLGLQGRRLIRKCRSNFLSRHPCALCTRSRRVNAPKIAAQGYLGASFSVGGRNDLDVI